MLMCSIDTIKSLPSEFISVAEELFPRAGSTENKGPSTEAVMAFADDLGIGDDFRRLLDILDSEEEMRKFLERFENNLDLLIQKTWVEKADEARKNALLDKVPPFITLIEKKDYKEALKEFGVILKELAYLFFGNQSQKEDFTEYTLRIDIQMGLFWWYGSMLISSGGLELAKSASSYVLLSVLLLGICYLTNF